MFSDAYRITRSLFIGHAQASRCLSKHVYDLVAQLKLRRRGCRSGVHVRRRKLVTVVFPPSAPMTGEIPTVIGRRICLSTNSQRNVNRVRNTVLRAVPRENKVLSQFNIGVLNVQSLGNKSTTIHNCIVEKHLDMMTILESWHDSFDTPSVLAATPVNYRVIERARPRNDVTELSMKSNHGGICVFIRSSIKVTIVDFPLYNTFELLPLYIHGNSINSLFLAVYRPGSKTPTAEFIDEITDVLDRSSSYSKCIMVGDVNVHLDDSAAAQSASFFNMLDDFGLSEWVKQPTHRQGHQLDVFITRANQPVSVVQVDPPLLISDHSLITASFSVPDQGVAVCRPQIQRRCWKRFDVEAFTVDFLASDLVVCPPVEVAQLFDCYNNTLRQLIDKHVPVVTVTNYSRVKSPWYDRECHTMQTKTRRLEKIYRRQRTGASEWDWREQYQLQRRLFSMKFTNHWTGKINSCGSNNKLLWSRLRVLLHPADSVVSEHPAEMFAQQFENEVERIRSLTANAPPPVITDRSVSEPLTHFKPVTSEEVMSVLRKTPAKQCSLDPVPTWLVKQLGSIFAPVIANLCNSSFDQRTLPADQKRAITRPLLKKPSLDASDVNNYRPISNLSFLSKTIERLVDAQLVSYADKNSLFPVYQSAYRAHHSTETALVHLYNDMVLAVDKGEVGALMLLDMSAAFDTIDHGIMLDVLRRRFNVQDAALDWFASYFTDRTHVVVAGTDTSSVRELKVGAPQGSVLGPRSFTVYAEDATDIFLQNRICHHIFADDMQGTKHAKPWQVNEVASELGRCMCLVNDWCASKRLQLNTLKTEVMWYGSATNLGKLSSSSKLIQIGSDILHPCDQVRDLGVYFDEELNMKAHIRRVAGACYYHLRRLRALRGLLGEEVTARLVSAFVLSRLDYCNAILTGLPASTLAPLQRVMHAGVRLVCDLKPRDHLSASIQALHWLPIKQRIDFKLCLLVHQTVNGRAPSYLQELITPSVSVPRRATLRSASHHDLVLQSSHRKLGDRSFSVAGPRAWNSLPVELKTITETSIFKRQLKTFLFKIAYHS
jgi:Reverse transcriptase (RNA-dependent DNA polymerase)/Endonuclease-reverse transcriptase